MPSIIHSGNNNSPNIINQLLMAIQAAITDIKMFYDNLSAGWSGTFTDGSGQTVTVVSGLVVSVEAPPLPPLRLTWDDIVNAIFTTVGEYNAAWGSDFTTLTVDGNDQLLTGNSTTFAMPNEAFLNNTYIVAINDEAESVISLGEMTLGGCTALTTASFPVCTSVGASLFEACFALTTVSLPLCAALGNTTGDDDVFIAINGNTITLTIAASRETCDGGNPDGDIVHLAANNTATINYV